MVQGIKKIWNDLGRNIFEGDRYERNMRGIALVAILIVVVNVITGSMNLVNRYYSVATPSFLFVVAAMMMLFFVCIKRNKTGAVITAMLAVTILFTYEIFTVTHGFPIFWTLLMPLAFGYLANVKSGIYISVYFMALYIVIFVSPLRQIFAQQYSRVICQRFPILFFADVAVTIYILVQYHMTTLHQMDYAKQLLEAKEAADRANVAKSVFLTNMSHEIRTPINAVLGMNEMILKESLQTKEQSADNCRALRTSLNSIGIYAGDVQKAGNNLLSIINDILDLSKIEAERMEIVEGEYQLSSVLNDLSNMIYFKLKEKHISFVMDVDETVPDFLYGDVVRVRQVILNILSNAVKYTNEGSVTLSITKDESYAPEDERKICLVIKVKDTGIGIKKEDMDRLFTKFERADLKANSTVEGTGLGLAISQALVTMMDGSISVESEFGKGSVFTIILPQGVVSDAPIGNLSERFTNSIPAAENYTESFTAPDAHVLIVDDTKMNLNVATGLLKNTGIRIDTAQSGEEAARLAQVNAYDVILMDQRMPKMDGTEALRLIRSQTDGANRDTPVICLTADAVIGARERYISEGFTDYLSKPIDSRVLEQVLIKYLPDEKVRIGKKEIREADNGQSMAEESMSRKYASLRDAGINTYTGLKYCQGDESLYNTLLEEYAHSSAEKINEIEQYCNTRDWKNYSVIVHALKSSSKMIGATALSETAARLETAADEGNERVIEAAHSDMIAEYRNTAQAVRDTLGDEWSDQEDDEILEFLPEE